MQTWITFLNAVNVFLFVIGWLTLVRWAITGRENTPLPASSSAHKLPEKRKVTSTTEQIPVRLESIQDQGDVFIIPKRMLQNYITHEGHEIPKQDMQDFVTTAAIEEDLSISGWRERGWQQAQIERVLDYLAYLKLCTPRRNGVKCIWKMKACRGQGDRVSPYKIMSEIQADQIRARPPLLNL